jgi:hypothetical protein
VKKFPPNCLIYQHHIENYWVNISIIHTIESYLINAPSKYFGLVILISFGGNQSMPFILLYVANSIRHL